MNAFEFGAKVAHFTKRAGGLGRAGANIGQGLAGAAGIMPTGAGRAAAKTSVPLDADALRLDRAKARADDLTLDPAIAGAARSAAGIPPVSSRAGTAAPAWVNSTKKVDAGLDPATGVKPGAVSPAPPAPVPAPTRGTQADDLTLDPAIAGTPSRTPTRIDVTKPIAKPGPGTSLLQSGGYQVNGEFLPFGSPKYNAAIDSMELSTSPRLQAEAARAAAAARAGR